MKTLKYLLVLIAILFVGFILIGVFKPSINYGSELEINKPVKEAWAVMNDESKTHLWLTGLESSELISGTAGEVGAVTKIVMAPEGSEVMEMTETITARKENEHMGFAFEAAIVSSTLDMYFSTKNGKTIMQSNATAKGKGMLMKSLMPIMKSAMQKSDLEIMANLKKVIEENTTDYFPQPKMEVSEMENTVMEIDATKG
ncbi:MAG: SRPBCC family protein [Saprospiraceae bacterium]